MFKKFDLLNLSHLRMMKKSKTLTEKKGKQKHDSNFSRAIYL